MARRHLPFLSIVLLLTSCIGDGPVALEPPPAPDGELVAWMEGFCEVRREGLRDLPQAPEIPRPSEESDRRPLIEFISAVVEALDGAERDIEQLGPAPVPGGDEVAEQYRADLRELRGLMEEYESNARVFPADALESVYTLAAVDALVAIPGGDGMTEYLSPRPELAAAAAAAPGCPGGPEPS